MEDFLSKPFQVSDLQDRLETAATIVKAMKG
jgi:FixJ family two-component response regulator